MNTTSTELITIGGSDDFVAPVPGDPAFIGPPHSNWTTVNLTREQYVAMRMQESEVEMDADPIQAMVLRHAKIDGRYRNSARYLNAREQAGQHMAMKLSPRGIAVGTFETLTCLEESIRIATQIANGEKIGAATPTIEDRIKAVSAVAVGAKAHAELSSALIEQLDPIKREDGDKPEKPRGPSRDTPVIPIQAQTVHVHTNGSAKNGSSGQ